MSLSVRVAVLASVIVSFPALVAPVALAQGAVGEQALRSTIAAQMAQGPQAEGAYVIDLNDGHVVFSDRPRVPRLSASLTKLFTTATALVGLGQTTRLATRVLATGTRSGSTWNGDFYLRGGGDFTFGTASFNLRAYGGGGSVEALATAIRHSGLRRIRGSVYGDASLFTDGPGSPFGLVLCGRPLFGPGCPYGPTGRFERPMPNGPRTAIGFNRGLVNDTSARPQRAPAQSAARALLVALKARGVRVDGGAGARSTPVLVQPLATTWSPSVARLITLINRPSDNYGADVLFRVLGARLEGQGSGPAGALAVSDAMRRFGLHPDIASGSGETVLDRSSPRDVVALLARMHRSADRSAFEQSLSQAGRSGTLARLAGTAAQGRCALKDGTRVDALPRTTLDISGYCRSVSGRSFAFAVMMNGMPLEFVPPDRIVSPAYALEDRIVEALAAYRG
jgi:D-alanyl-D-alanine carboxypeptidase/D-alanyl-D-alanine-endopeptidase (penicillin-binding protein 4)